MARNYKQGYFTPKNPQKYIGGHADRLSYRSSMELVMMTVCDENDKIQFWASESIQIPYQNPFNGKWTLYIPDFLIIYEDSTGKVSGELVEIKSLSQSVQKEARGDRDRAQVIINHAKWKAAMQFCAKRGLKFRVMTEGDIGGYKKKR